MAAAKKKPWTTGVSSGHITNLKQSIFVFRYLWSSRTLAYFVTASMKKQEENVYEIVCSTSTTEAP
jgi:hypothetical protein